MTCLTRHCGASEIEVANDLVLGLIAKNPAKVDGINISQLDQAHVEAFRARLPDGARLYTGDDFNCADLIAGDGTQPSHALLGIFAAIAYRSRLNGYQNHFIMPAGFCSSRDITQYSEVFRLANAAGLLLNPDLAEARMKALLVTHGIGE